MRHSKKGRKFGREKKQRNALMKSLAVSLIQHGRIQTTEAKAKSLRPYVDKLVTKGKHESLASRRYLSTRIGDKAASRIAKEIAPRYQERQGGYTRITKLGPRRSDGAREAIIEFS